jgi:hypothetical protein
MPAICGHLRVGERSARLWARSCSRGGTEYRPSAVQNVAARVGSRYVPGRGPLSDFGEAALYAHLPLDTVLSAVGTGDLRTSRLQPGRVREDHLASWAAAVHAVLLARQLGEID